MDGNWQLGLFFFGLWIISVFAGWAFFRLKKGLRPAQIKPELLLGGTWRLRDTSGTYRVRLMSEADNRYVVTAPMKADAYVPLRPGDSIHVEAPTDRGAVTFRTVILRRNAEDKTLELLAPEDFVERNRRDHFRETFLQPQPAFINGEAAWMVDISEGGARVKARTTLSAGDWVRLQSDLMPERFACVLEVLPDEMDGRPAQSLRVLFAEPVA